MGAAAFHRAPAATAALAGMVPLKWRGENRMVHSATASESEAGALPTRTVAREERLPRCNQRQHAWPLMA